jgi:ATP-binding cassette subfamily B protein
MSSSPLSADVIFVIKIGRLIEQGTRDELLRRNGIYAELEHLQFGEEDPAERLVSYGAVLL